MTTKPGWSAVTIAVFFRVFATANAVATASSEVSSARTTSTSGITATGLKKWNPTRRSGFVRTDAISSTDSDDVFVARIASGAMTCSIFRKTSCLTPISSKTASITQSASAKASYDTDPLTSAVMRFASSGRHAPLLEQLRDLTVDACDTGVHP